MKKYFTFVNFFRTLLILSLVLTVFYLRVGDPYSAIMSIICAVAAGSVVLDISKS